MNKATHLNRYMWTIIALGAAVCAFSLSRLSVGNLDLHFFLLALVTVGLSSRVTIQIPRFNSHIAVSDTFIFLALLLYGGEAAILLAVVEAFCSASRFCKRRLTVFFNAGVMACSTFTVVWVLRLTLGKAVALTEGDNPGNFYVAVCVVALVQYVVNSGLASIYGALKSEQPLWQTWRRHYLWTSLTYFAGAAAAGALAKLAQIVGFKIVIATTPIIAIIYFTYRTYLKNVEISLQQAEQAERHAAALEEQKAALIESEERFRSSFDYASTGMALVSPEGRWLQVNRALCEIVGYEEAELLAMDFQTLTLSEDLGSALANLNMLLAGQTRSCQMEMRYTHRRGHTVWVLWNVSVVRESRTKALSLIFQLQDITARKRAEQQLLHDALHDALTGLPNRALFTDHLKLAIERAKRDEARLFAVLFLDLDRFKYVNDSLGHMVGDQLLIDIARRLMLCVRRGDTVARLGGDEFTVLLDDIPDMSEATLIAERIRVELSRPFDLSGHEVFTSASIGIASSEGNYERPEDVLRDADTAMYRAKALGRARHETFNLAMHHAAKETLFLETDLRRAIEREEFRIHYQPIISLETNEISGFEALVRWQHPQRGLISPDKFIPLAEETGLIIPIGEWVLKEACRQTRRWHDQFPQRPPLFVSVNLSSRQFAQPNLIGVIEDCLRVTGLDARLLKLEITESVVMEDQENVINLLRRLQDLGVELSIDDFGTGYSSLGYLHRLPVQTLKIDRSFVSRMNDLHENSTIVHTIMTLAGSLNMKVIAEGVETKEQATQLKALECEGAQGYFFSKPLDTQAATNFLTAAYLPASNQLRMTNYELRMMNYELRVN